MNEKSVFKETVASSHRGSDTRNELIRVKIPLRREKKADVSCIGPSLEQIDSFNRS